MAEILLNFDKKKSSLQFWLVQNCKKITGKIFSPNICQKWVIYQQKTWRAGLWNMKFCVRSNQTVLRKKGENKIFHSAAIHGANICQIFVYVLHYWKIFGVFFTAIFNWSPKTYSHPSNYLLELQLILVDFSCLRGHDQLIPKFLSKVKLQRGQTSNISIWNN